MFTLVPHQPGRPARQYQEWAARRGLAQSSIDVQSRIIDLADRQLPGGLAGATADDVAAWVAGPVTRRRPQTRRAYSVALRNAARAGVAVHVESLPPVRIPRSVPHPTPDDVTDRLLDGLDDPVLRTAALLARFAGLRCAECCSVGPDDLVRCAGGWRVHVVGKGGVERLAPVPAWVVDEVRPWLPITRNPRSLGARLGEAIKRCGGRRGMHCLRAAYATELMRTSGHDLRLVQSALGHASITTTAVYLAVDDDESTRAVESLRRPPLRLVPPPAA